MYQKRNQEKFKDILMSYKSKYNVEKSTDAAKELLNREAYSLKCF
jgi:prefoldin subunit 5